MVRGETQPSIPSAELSSIRLFPSPALHAEERVSHEGTVMNVTEQMKSALRDDGAIKIERLLDERQLA